jgi:hypothetical protein
VQAAGQMKPAFVLLAGLAMSLLASSTGRVMLAPWRSLEAFDSAFPTIAVSSPVGSPGILASKPSLLYFTLAGSDAYEQMLRLFLITLRPILTRLGSSLHLLVITRQENLENVISILNEVVPSPKQHNVSVHTLPAYDVFDAAVNKLAIGKLDSFPLLDDVDGSPLYSRVMYADVDMLVIPAKDGRTWPLEKLLRPAEQGGVSLRKGTIYAPGEPRHDIGEEFFSLKGKRAYTEEQLAVFRQPLPVLPDASVTSSVPSAQKPLVVKRPGTGTGETAHGLQTMTYVPANRKLREPINTGFFVFEPNAETLLHINAAYEAAITTPKNERPEFCMEQPYLNHQLHRFWYENRDKAGFVDPVDWRLLENMVISDTKNTALDGESLPEDTAVVHITGLSAFPERASQAKLARMRALFSRMVTCFGKADDTPNDAGASAKQRHCPAWEDFLV